MGTIISIIILLISFGIFIYSYSLLKKENNKIRIKNKKELDKELEKSRRQYDNEINKINEMAQKAQETYKSIVARNNEEIKRIEEQRNLIISQKEEIINKEIEKYRIIKENELNEDYRISVAEMELALEDYNKVITISMEEAEKQLEKVIKELEDYRLRRATINEAIMRERELQEKETFYKLNITENDIEDIRILRTIEPKLKNKEALNRLIFDVFIKKPMNEMIKRVLNGGAPSGIYKITYIPTGEVYVGKSTNTQKRWQEHIKSSLDLGTIAHSSLHTKMARDGLWNFTFELLEEVPKDKLTEREKYWINFYDSKKYGLNEREG